MEIANPKVGCQQELYAEVCSQIRNEFSERDWRLFWRTVVDGQPSSEAASEHGISANAARLVKMRVLRRIRQLVAEHGT
jgi:hypothetical protein